MTEKDNGRAEQEARAQYETLEIIVNGLSFAFDRWEELRAEKKYFSAGWNMPGFMPDCAPGDFETVEEAADYLADSMEDTADYLEDSADYGDLKKAEGMREQAGHVRTSTGEVSFYAADGLVYWIAQAHQFGLDDSDYEELLEMEEQAEQLEGLDISSQEDAADRILEDPLSVDIRSDWESYGSELTPSEFRILLCTGGPAVQIRGELSSGEPCRAWLEYQDWFTPWTQYFGTDQDVLLTYCRQFYFGE